MQLAGGINTEGSAIPVVTLTNEDCLNTDSESKQNNNNQYLVFQKYLRVYLFILYADEITLKRFVYITLKK